MKTQTQAQVQGPTSPVEDDDTAAPPLDEDASGFDVGGSEEPTGFAALALPPKMLQVLEGLGFATPTPIQARAIPPLLEGKHLVGQARTGTGKTAAFGLPLIVRLAQERGRGVPRALVLTPTRELALQVSDALQQFAEGSGLRFVTVYGGSAYGPQLRALRDGVDVVVGTPGRIIDLMERGQLALGEIAMVVLDEADEMLEMGFIEAVETILAQTPEATRQVALFSATMPGPIRKVAERYLKDPVAISEASQTVTAIAQRFVQVPNRYKPEALMRILRSEVRDATLVFASTRASCADAADFLATRGIPAEPLHGDLSQAARERVVELLRARRVEVVVATDIAARGIDIEHLTHIVNLDLPRNIEVYTHRIGRTGRAGRSGTAITLVTPREAPRFVEALRRRGVQPDEMFVASEQALAERQRARAMEDAGRLAGERPRTIEEARVWVATLVEAGEAVEEVAAKALALLGEERNLRLGQALDRGLPPWARQPALPAPTPAKKKASAKEKGARGEAALADLRAARDVVPEAEGFVVVGLGRADGVRANDLVGALTNELGLTGRDIGRVEIRDHETVIGVPASFVARVGDGAWAMSIRRMDTTIRRHDGPPPAPPRAARAPAREERPVRARDERPVRARDERPARAHDERPVRARDERPVRAHDERPVRARDERPVHVDDERSARANAERPARVRDERPTRAQEPSAPAHEERPAPPRDERPKRGNEERPSPTHEARPKRLHESAPPTRREPARDDRAPRPAPRASREVHARDEVRARPERSRPEAAKPKRTHARTQERDARTNDNGRTQERPARAPRARPEAPRARPGKRPARADLPPRRAVDVEPRRRTSRP